MTDYINKKVNFFHSKISVKINKTIYFGSSSKIYLCSDVSNPSVSYCLKIATVRSNDKNGCNTLNTEIIILLGLKDKHNIVQIIDYYSHELDNCVTYFILMEYCGNGSLADTMAKLSNEKNTYSEPQIWKILHNICTGLVAIHNNKTAHRDLRPENILITFDGVYKICDFGSATNKFYETMYTSTSSYSSNNIKNEIIFDISRNTTPGYRAPEQIDIYTEYPINEKVDLWALGVILFSLLFDSVGISDNLNSHMRNDNRKGRIEGIVLNDEMTQSYSNELIEILKALTNPNPTIRISAGEVVNFIERNKDKIMNIDKNKNNVQIQKHSRSWAKILSDANAKFFKRHSTHFWVLKLMNNNFDAFPKFKYIKLLVSKAWTKRQKINKLFHNISTRPVHYFSFLALKSLYIIHHYIFLGPNETLNPQNFNLDEFLDFFINLWSMRYSSGIYDKEEVLKNSHVTKFIVTYAELMKAKIAYHRRYSYIENNFSIENLQTKNFDFSILVDKKFITDTISLYSLIYQKFIQVPIIVTQISSTLDMIIQVLNEELVSLFNFTFYVLVAYKNYNSTNYNVSNYNKPPYQPPDLNIWDSQFLEITNTAKGYVERYKRFRDGIKGKKSKCALLDFGNSNCPNDNNSDYDNNSNVFFEYFKSLDNNLKYFPNNDFNINSFFSNDRNKSIVGIKLNVGVEKLIKMNLFFNQGENKIQSIGQKNVNQNQINNLKNSFGNVVNTDINKQARNTFIDKSINIFEKINFPEKIPNNSNNNFLNINTDNRNIFKPEYTKKEFEFSEEKFLNSKMNFDFDLTNNYEQNNPQSNDLFQIENKPRSNTCNLTTFIKNTKIEKHINKHNNENYLINSEIPDLNNNKQTTVDKYKLFDPHPNTESLFNHNIFFEPNKNTVNLNNQTKTFTNNINANQDSDINNNNFNVINLLNNIFESNNARASPYNNNTINITNNSYVNDQNSKISNGINIYEKTAEKKESNVNSEGKSSTATDLNKILNLYNDSLKKYHNDTNNLENITGNNLKVKTNIISNNLDTKTNQPVIANHDSPGSQINNSEGFNYESVKSDFPPISIINIQNNFNGVKVFSDVNVETLANDFLKEELSKKNLQWLISSKDIKCGKQIGFGGSSEVFIGDYRGTEVAVKKLRILEVQEENLKEFKREVSSLIMLRHPNLVLFMGAIAEKDNICIITEYCAGGTLFNILHQTKYLVITWELRIRILLEIAVGMNFLHTNSPPIIHRDLKSLNILLTEKIERPADNTRVKISDFGLSKIIKSFDSGRETMTGQLGTCHWMAPEVIENKQYTLKADVFSYGIIIWEIITRKTPYSDMSQQQISFYVTVKKGRPDKNLIPHNTPQSLMEMCWDVEPNNRPSFKEIIEYIRQIKL